MKPSSALAMGFGIVMGCALFNFFRFYSDVGGVQPAKELLDVVDVATGLGPPLSVEKGIKADLGLLLKLGVDANDVGVDISAASPPSIQTSTKTTTSKGGRCNVRKFVSYTSSPWEEKWLAGIREWQSKKYVCDALFDQPEGFGELRQKHLEI